MSKLSLAVFFTISTIFSSHCMEPTTPKKSSKDKGLTRSKSRSLLSLSRKSSEEKSLISNPQPEHPFISVTQKALESNDYTAMKFYLSDPHLNPNMPNRNGYPSLHIFAQAKNYKGMRFLLDDPRTDVSTQDIEQKQVSDYINKTDEDLSELRRELFARYILDTTTYQKCVGIKSFYDRCLMTNTHITGMIEQIKNKINNDPNQSDQEVPQSAKFPDYANDEFMTKKIWFILSLLSTQKTAEEK